MKGSIDWREKRGLSWFSIILLKGRLRMPLTLTTIKVWLGLFLLLLVFGSSSRSWRRLTRVPTSSTTLDATSFFAIRSELGSSVGVRKKNSNADWRMRIGIVREQISLLRSVDDLRETRSSTSIYPPEAVQLTYSETRLEHFSPVHPKS